MKCTGSIPPQNPQGSALVLSLIFIAVFAAMAAALATVSNANVRIADNFRKANMTRGSAESGLEVVRYWLSRVDMSGKIAPSERFSHMASTFQNQLTDAGITNIVPVVSSSTITISNVPLLSSAGQSFSAVLTKIDNDNVRLDITGCYSSLSRTIHSNFVFGETANTVFDFGVVSKGPLSLQGSVDVNGVNVNVESNAYIESLNTLLALSVGGSSEIGGNVKIVNPDADVFLGPNASVGGDTGTEAMEHIRIGVAPSSFPEMDPNAFIPYATNLLSTSTDLKADQTLTNVHIPAGMNPKFTAKATIRGVLYIETPNVVEFGGTVNVMGIIVTDGDPTDNSGTSQLKFTGTVDSHPVTELPVENQFNGLHTKLGTFIMAPGCAVSFSGNFSTLNGAIAANGVSFSGNAGGMIHGSVINYANTAMELGGNSDLLFNRSGLDQVPAGFVPRIIVRYDPTSYTEAAL